MHMASSLLSLIGMLSWIYLLYECAQDSYPCAQQFQRLHRAHGKAPPILSDIFISPSLPHPWG